MPPDANDWTDLAAPGTAQVPTTEQPSAQPAVTPTSPPQTSSTVDSIANAIASVESGGRYDALGPLTKTGDRAHGKYQIMGSNIPSWTQDATGKWADSDEFLKNPDLQDRTAKYKIKQIYDKRGNVRDVASMWHSGAPYEQAVREGRKDSLGTLTKDYADKVAAMVEGAGAAPPEVPSALTEAPSTPPTPQETAATSGDWTDLASSQQPPADAELRTHRTRETGFVPDVRGMTNEDTAKWYNRNFGLDDEDWRGQFIAGISKPGLDLLHNMYDAFATPVKEGRPATLVESAMPLVRAAQGLGVPAEIAGNVTEQGLKDGLAAANVDPDNADAIAKTGGALVTLAVGAKTPIPGVPEVSPAEMPLQGTKLTRQAAQEATAAATEAETRAAGAKAASEASMRQAEREAAGVAEREATRAEGVKSAGEAETTAARQDAERVVQEAETKAAEARRVADEAKVKTQPSPEVAQRATEALAPTKPEVPATGEAATTSLEKRLGEVRAPVEKTYDDFVARHRYEFVNPSDYKGMSDEIADLRAAGKLRGDAGRTIEGIDAKLQAGQKITVEDLDNYKMALDEALPTGEYNPAQKNLYKFKFNIRDRIRAGASADELDELKAADSVYRDVIIGRGKPRALGQLVKVAKKDPETFVERFFGEGTSDKQGLVARETMKWLEGSPTADALRQAYSRRMFMPTGAPDAAVDPKALLAGYDRLDPMFRDTMFNPGQKTFFEVLRNEQRAAEVAEAAAREAESAVKPATRTAASKAADVADVAQKRTAEAAKAAKEAGTAAQKRAAAARDTAEKATAEAEKQAEAAKGTAEKATATAKLPNRAAILTAKGLEIAGGEAVAAAFGYPGVGALGLGRLFLPPDRLATWLANSNVANALARLMKATPRSAVVPATLKYLKDNGILFEQEKPAEEPKAKAAA